MVGNPVSHCTRRSLNFVFLSGNSLRTGTVAKYINKVSRDKILLQNEVMREKSEEANIKHFEISRMQCRNRLERMKINPFPGRHFIVGLEMEEKLEDRKKLFDRFRLTNRHK
jgi:hypothetical protein